MNKALILCRGNSLSRAAEIANNHYDACFIVNKWDEQLAMPLFSFLKKQNLFHFLNRERQNILAPVTYWEFGIQQAYLNILKKEMPKSVVAKVLRALNIKCIPMSEDVKQWALDGKASFPSCGVSALVSIAAGLKAKEITVIGMDFFQADYFTYHASKGGKEVKDYQRVKNARMMEFVQNFCKANPSITFNFVTESNLPSSDNIHVL